MKNVAISPRGKTNTVSAQDLIDAMVPNYEYTVEQVVDLLPEFPKTSVRDALHALVSKGAVWRNASSSRVKFALLEGERLQDAIDSKTKRLDVPDWMKNNLVGYERSQNGFRDLCLLARK
jgi:hypothetical protein